MSAIQFIKEHGVDKAREVLEGAPDGATHLSDDTRHYVNADFKPLPAHIKEQLPKLVVLNDLKRLVESVDLIKKHGGLFSTKCQLDKGGSHYEWYGENGEYGLTDLEDLEQAIADYESIYGGEHV